VCQAISTHCQSDTNFKQLQSSCHKLAHGPGNAAKRFLKGKRWN